MATVLNQSIRRSRVTGPPKSVKSHSCPIVTARGGETILSRPNWSFLAPWSPEFPQIEQVANFNARGKSKEFLINANILSLHQPLEVRSLMETGEFFLGGHTSQLNMAKPKFRRHGHRSQGVAN